MSELQEVRQELYKAMEQRTDLIAIDDRDVYMRRACCAAYAEFDRVFKFAADEEDPTRLRELVATLNRLLVAIEEA